MATVYYILDTPELIYQHAQKHFAQAKIEVLSTSYKVRLILSSDFPALDLEYAVETNEFMKCLSKLKQSQCIPGKTFSLDTKSFSTTTKLSWQGWYKSERAAYESTGYKCRDVIAAFLADPKNDKMVHKLGLAPDQVEGNAERTLKYFLEFLDAIKNQNKAKKELLLNNFQKQYPNTHFAICSQEVQKLQSQPDNLQSIKIEEKLRQMVIGQEVAIKKTVSTLVSQISGDKNRAFLCVGPSGIGKTELAKSLAALKGKPLLFLNMEKYSDKYKTSDLWGSGSGYVGSTSKPHFANELDKYASKEIKKEGNTITYEVENIVICFDEIEKSDSIIKQSLLSLIDEGRCTFYYTEDKQNLTLVYEFKKSIMVFTSNLYSEYILDAFNSKLDVDKMVQLFKELNRDKKESHSFAPEWLGRVDIIPFGPIPRGDEYQTLLKIKLNKLLKDTIVEFPKLKSFELEDSPSLLPTLEHIYYRNGIDFRTVERSLDEIIKSALQKNLKSDTLVLFHDGHDLIIKQSLYIEKLETYHPIDPIILKLPKPL